MATAPAPARPRPGGGRLFIIVGLLLAVLAGGGVFFLGTLGGGGGGITGGSKVTVVTAATSIPLRAPIKSEDLTTEDVNGVFVNTYPKVSDVVNLIAQVNISKGTIITSDMLVKDAGLITTSNAPAYLPLASGYVAMAIPTSEQVGVAGHITIGDYITMIASANRTLFSKTGQQQGPPQQVVKTVFTNIRVIQVGPAQINVQPAAGSNAATSNQGQVGGVTSSLTIEVTQCDAEFIQWFLANSVTLKYTLESFHDYQPPPTGPDPACLTVTASKGVSAADVDKRFSFSTGA
ncbi:MAG TPA: RcpC/CpaB family pilus assembly protein [Candidatus Dormibacteraeota bacterium]|nr:RcpC/CpaB family pilus assembly protein [Candidatus Dormibacteraeota bacterium]